MDLILRHKSGPEFYFSLSPKKPRRIHATFGEKTRQLWKPFFQVVSLGARPWFALLLLDANISTLTNKDLHANHFWSGNFQRHNPESINSATWIPRAEMHARSPLCLRSPSVERSSPHSTARGFGSATSLPSKGAAMEFVALHSFLHEG